MAAKFRCQRCSHTWSPRGTDTPKQCPSCKNPKWNLTRKRKESKRTEIDELFIVLGGIESQLERIANLLEEKRGGS